MTGISDGVAGWRSGHLAGLIVCALLVVYTLSTALVPIRADNDCWWHVKTGWYIANNGIPSHDVFNFNAADMEWHNHEWLAQLVMYHAWSAGDAAGIGGWRGLVLFMGLVITATTLLVAWLARRISGCWWIALLVAVLCVAVGRRMFYPRPPVFTNFMLILQLILLVGLAEGWFRDKMAFLLVPLIALWTNVHGGWMAAGVILAAWSTDQFYHHFRERLPALPTTAPRLLPMRMLMVLLPLCLLATLFNPYLWHLYRLPGRVLGDLDLVRSIGELHSPDFYFVIDFELAVHAGLLMALFLPKFRPRLWEVLVYLFFLHQAMQHVRHLSLFSIMMVPLYARLLAAAVDGAGDSLAAWRRSEKWRRVPVLAVGALAVYTMQWVLVNPRESGGLIGNSPQALYERTYPGRNLQFLSGTGYVRANYPANVVDLIELSDLQGNMFNENTYAGYLIWRLAPDPHRVFSDSRFDIFGGDIQRIERQIAQGAVHVDSQGQLVQRWSNLLDTHDVQWLITRGGTGLSRRLHDLNHAGGDDDAPWVLGAAWDVYTGAPLDWWSWQIWVRNTEENRSMVSRLRANAPLAGAWAP